MLLTVNNFRKWCIYHTIHHVHLPALESVQPHDPYRSNPLEQLTTPSHLAFCTKPKHKNGNISYNTLHLKKVGTNPNGSAMGSWSPCVALQLSARRYGYATSAVVSTVVLTNNIHIMSPCHLFLSIIFTYLLSSAFVENFFEHGMYNTSTSWSLRQSQTVSSTIFVQVTSAKCLISSYVRKQR